MCSVAESTKLDGAVRQIGKQHVLRDHPNWLDLAVRNSIHAFPANNVLLEWNGAATGGNE